jgi:hypothetical protein
MQPDIKRRGKLHTERKKVRPQKTFKLLKKKPREKLKKLQIPHHKDGNPKLSANQTTQDHRSGD